MERVDGETCNYIHSHRYMSCMHVCAVCVDPPLLCSEEEGEENSVSSVLLHPVEKVSAYVLHELYIIVSRNWFVCIYIRHTLQQWWENVQFHRLQRDLAKTALTHFEKTAYRKVLHVPPLTIVNCILFCIQCVVSVLWCGRRGLPKESRQLRERARKCMRSLWPLEEVGKIIT